MSEILELQDLRPGERFVKAITKRQIVYTVHAYPTRKMIPVMGPHSGPAKFSKTLKVRKWTK